LTERPPAGGQQLGCRGQARQRVAQEHDGGRAEREPRRAGHGLQPQEDECGGRDAEGDDAGDRPPGAGDRAEPRPEHGRGHHAAGDRHAERRSDPQSCAGQQSPGQRGDGDAADREGQGAGGQARSARVGLRRRDDVLHRDGRARRGAQAGRDLLQRLCDHGAAGGGDEDPGPVGADHDGPVDVAVLDGLERRRLVGDGADVERAGLPSGECLGELGRHRRGTGNGDREVAGVGADGGPGEGRQQHGE
jgi:hypothetical protein